MADHLTIQKEGFVQDLLKGESQRTAYKNNFKCNKMKDKSIDEKASRLFANDKVRSRYNELKDKLAAEAEKEGLLSALDVLRGVADIIQATKESEPKTALKGYEMYGKYHKLFTDRIESENTNKNVNLEVDSVEEADRIIAEFEKKK